jgi:trans-2,3-dihydro-3-hydroxyanthranilate isomerase
MFTPCMTEDPATGSATAATAALLAELQGGEELGLRVGRGVDMGRSSILLARVRKLDGATATFVGGRCVAVMEGTFHLVGEAEATA